MWSKFLALWNRIKERTMPQGLDALTAFVARLNAEQPKIAVELQRRNDLIAALNQQVADLTAKAAEDDAVAAQVAQANVVLDAIDATVTPPAP
jgi:molybdopterin converting factor small subunit